jgi:hypothetical protein
MVKGFVAAGKAQNLENMGVLIAVCYGGLYRMGELSSTSSKPFNPDTEVCEADLHFEPDFWNATRVVINLGPTKADQQGKKASFN